MFNCTGDFSMPPNNGLVLNVAWGNKGGGPSVVINATACRIAFRCYSLYSRFKEIRCCILYVVSCINEDFIGMFTHFKLCLTDAIHNFK